MYIDFELAIQNYDVIELRWPVPFGHMNSSAYQALADALEPVSGVNRVEVLRYSAHVEIAAHVQNLVSVLEDIREYVLEDPQLKAELAAVGVTNYGVTVCPDVVTRRLVP